VSQGGALGVLEAEVRGQEKPLVVLCTRGEIKPDAIAEEATKKTPADASCIKCVRVTTWDSHPCTEAAQVQSGLAARRSTLSTAPSKGLAHGVKRRAACGRARRHETHELQLHARGDMYSRQHSMVYEHVHNIQENNRSLSISRTRSRTPHRLSRSVRRCFRVHSRHRRERILTRDSRGTSCRFDSDSACGRERRGLECRPA
jgi:hypothetical protein